MKILSNYSQYRQALKEIDPYRIAVAYIGLDYSAYIKTKKIREFIVSPTVGSNPHAISSVIKSIGISNVYFIDNLHSKLYIGKKGAIIGSANLSRNALDEQGLLELGVLIDSEKDMKKVNQLFNEYKKIAKKLYTNSSLKELRIAKLYNDHHKIILSFNKKLSNVPKRYFEDYVWGVDEPFKLSWYEFLPEDVSSYNKKQFYKEFPGANWKDIYSNIWCDMEIPKGDKIDEGEWLLTFFLDKNSKCKKTGLEWMFIDKKIKNAYKKGYYPDSVLQLKNFRHSSPPFIIDRKFKSLFAEVINEDRYKSVRESMYIKNITPYINRILIEIKNKY